MRNSKLSFGLAILAALAFAALVPPTEAQQTGDKNQPGKKTAGVVPAQTDLKAQTKCPIMGGKIDKQVYADAAGYRIYACCPGCIDKIKADPAKALKTLKKWGEKAELHLTLCTKCGEIKGTKQCCDPKAVKCSVCSMDKGSIGCCQQLSGAKGKPITDLCGKCGEVKGSTKCCTPGAARCDKCKMNKGAPGCCKPNVTDASKKEIVICPKCGEFMRTAKCCQADAPVCPKCGLHKGAPGCCKLGEFLKNQ